MLTFSNLGSTELRASVHVRSNELVRYVVLRNVYKALDDIQYASKLFESIYSSILERN